MRFVEAYVENLIYKIKILFSIETLCLAGLWWGWHRIADRLHELTYFFVVILLFLLVYGTGEFIRRKYKFKSLFFVDTKDNEKRQQILKLAKDRPDITVEMISDNIGIPQSHIIEYIRALKKIGALEQMGTRKNPHWIVNSPD